MVELVEKRYGKALFDIAKEENTVDAFDEEVISIIKLITDEKEFIELLNHPSLSRNKRIELIKEAFEGRVSNEIIGFMVLAINKGRQENIPGILAYAHSLVEEHRGFLNAYIESAMELSEKDIEVIKKKLEVQTDKKILIKTSVNEELLGGISIRIGDRIVDNTVLSALKRMSKEIIETKVNK